MPWSCEWSTLHVTVTNGVPGKQETVHSQQQLAIVVPPTYSSGSRKGLGNNVIVSLSVQCSSLPPTDLCHLGKHTTAL
jgi:hypothetical protein